MRIKTTSLIAFFLLCLGIPRIAGAQGTAIDPYQLAPQVSSAGGFIPQGRPTDPYSLGVYASDGIGGVATTGVIPQENLSAAVAPVAGLSIFQGGPVYNSLRQFDPLMTVPSGAGSRLFFRGEYLLWDVDGMESPPLVTTSPNGTAQTIAGVLGQEPTSILFGGGELNEGTTGGYLFSGGLWLTRVGNIALEGEIIGLDEQDDRYNGSSDGSVILARPFFDVTTGIQSAQLFSFPGLASGSIGIRSETDLRSYLLNARIGLCPQARCRQCGETDTTDWIIGYRNIRLRDTFDATEALESQVTGSPGSITIHDSFQTTNQFEGLQLGVVHRMVLNYAFLESTFRIALGQNEQSLRIGGTTSIDDNGVVSNFNSGFLAQRTNSGLHKRDEFMLVPELGIRLGIQLTRRLYATIGYSALYLPNVIRGTEQIDTDINPGLFPVEANPLTGGLRPRVLFVQNDYLAHGIHFGGELQF
ncbi:MAG: BBP7 family outer membrane beta-barrel protein [Planctomycetota bacterium]